MQKLASILLSLVFLQPSIQAENSSEFEAGCDIPIGTTRSIKQSTMEACKIACDSDKTCQASVYVSGWNRCFLKSKTKPKHQIEFISANKNDANLAYGTDNSGKDIKKYNFKNVEACQEECKKEASCGGFTYIKGYQNCWLKKSGGKLYEKKFYCYQKQ